MMVAIMRALPKKRVSPADAEDRAAALALCLFSEIACIADPVAREAFLSSMWVAHGELVAKLAAVNDHKITRVVETVLSEEARA